MLKPKSVATALLSVPLLLGCGSAAKSLPSAGSTAVSPTGTARTWTTSLGGKIRVGPAGTIDGLFIAEGGLSAGSNFTLKGTVTLTNASTKVAYKYGSGPDGKFSALVPPGTYTAAGLTYQYNYSKAECQGDKPVTVVVGKTVSVTVACQMK